MLLLAVYLRLFPFVTTGSRLPLTLSDGKPLSPLLTSAFTSSLTTTFQAPAQLENTPSPGKKPLSILCLNWAFFTQPSLSSTTKSVSTPSLPSSRVCPSQVASQNRVSPPLKGF